MACLENSRKEIVRFWGCIRGKKGVNELVTENPEVDEGRFVGFEVWF